MAANPIPRGSTKTLTLKKEMYFFTERGNDSPRVLQPGDKIKVTWTPGTGFGGAYIHVYGKTFSHVIKADEGRESFKNWPKEWIDPYAEFEEQNPGGGVQKVPFDTRKAADQFIRLVTHEGKEVLGVAKQGGRWVVDLMDKVSPSAFLKEKVLRNPLPPGTGYGYGKTHEIVLSTRDYAKAQRMAEAQGGEIVQDGLWYLVVVPKTRNPLPPGAAPFLVQYMILGKQYSVGFSTREAAEKAAEQVKKHGREVRIYDQSDRVSNPERPNWYDFGYTRGTQDRKSADVGLSIDPQIESHNSFSFIWDRALSNGEAKESQKQTASTLFTAGYYDAHSRRPKRVKSSQDKLGRIKNPEGDLGQEAFDAGKDWYLDGQHSSGVSNANVVHYGFVKWWNNQSPQETKGQKKASLESAFREGWNAGKRVSKRNPESSAASMYESFHGRPSTEVVEFEEELHYHEHLSGLGIMVELKVITMSGFDVTLEFGCDSDEDALENPRKGANWLEGHSGGISYAKADGYRELDADQLSALADRAAKERREKDKQRGIKPRDWPRWKPGFKAGYKQAVMESKLGFPWGRPNPKLLEPTGAPAWKRMGIVPKLYKGYTIVKSGNDYLVPEIDPQSSFESDKEAKRFVDSWAKKNPSAFPGADAAVKKAETLSRKAEAADRYAVRQDTPEAHDAAYTAHYRAARAHESAAFSSRHSLGSNSQIDYHTQKAGYHNAQARVHGRNVNPESQAVSPDTVLLCSNEDGNQLYFQGGDQSLNLKSIHMDGAWERDSMVIGVLYEITYHTEKKFDKFKPTDYYHRLGEDTKDEPMLIYDRLNQKLSVSGGQYHIEKPLIGMSPGIEN